MRHIFRIVVKKILKVNLSGTSIFIEVILKQIFPVLFTVLILGMIYSTAPVFSHQNSGFYIIKIHNRNLILSTPKALYDLKEFAVVLHLRDKNFLKFLFLPQELYSFLF